MTQPVLLDTNLALLLVVGSADRRLIQSHKRLDRYTPDHFDLLTECLGRYSDLVFISYVLAETYNLAKQIDGPARATIRNAFRTMVAAATELPVAGREAVAHPGYDRLGLTDAALLHVSTGLLSPALATADRLLADMALSLSCEVLDFSTL